MSSDFNGFKKEIKGKKVAVLGIGISHRPLIKKLCQYDAEVYAFDAREREQLQDFSDTCTSPNLHVVCGKQYLSQLNERTYSYIFRTPGMRPDKPEILQAVKNGAELTSEMEMFFELCPAKIFAITGSDGKTTTTTLVHKLLETEGFKCRVGGNIGAPLFDRLDDIKADEKIIVELSSFQLMTMKVSPTVAVITNLSPNHLDIHKDVEEYYDAKKNIYRHTTREGNSPERVVLNYDNQLTRLLEDDVMENVGRGKLFWFSRTELFKVNTKPEGNIVFQDKEQISLLEEEKVSKVLPVESIQIPGVHNIENYMAAIAAVWGFVSIETIMKVATTFMGVEHRIEFVRELNGVRFYNDSIASSPNRTIAGLNSFEQKLILLAGGKDKGISYDSIGKPIVDHVKKLYLIGPTSAQIEAAVLAEIEKRENNSGTHSNEITKDDIYHCQNYEELVLRSFKEANKGDVIILSPASTSFDMFSNFEERGNTFKNIVNNL